MDQIHRIRQLYYEQGQDNISEIARLTGLNRKTVTKYIDMTDFNEADPMPKKENFCPKLDPFKPIINRAGKALLLNVLSIILDEPLPKAVYSAFGKPYSRFIASDEMTHCLPNLQTS